MTDHFMNQIFKTSVAAVCQKMGWDAAQTSAIDVLADLWRRQLTQLGKTCHRYSEHYGRTEVTHDDVALAFREMNVSIPELEEYVQNFDPVHLPYRTPKFPVSKQSHLNFLRPGSKEVLTRPVHIHEYLPPMEITEEKVESVSNGELNGFGGDKEDQKTSVHRSEDSSTGATEHSKVQKEVTVKVEEPESFLLPEKNDLGKGSGGGVEVENGDEPTTDAAAAAGFKTFAGTTKRGSSVGENPALKRVRILMEEEGHPLREISSVMMTTSGFLSSSREGRLPESKPPGSNRDFFDVEPVVEKKKKIVTMKKIVEGVKKIEKENQDEVEHELFGKPDRLVVPEARSKVDGSSNKSKDSSLSKKSKGGESETKAKHAEKESKSKLKIFKKKSREAGKHRREERERPQLKVEIKVEQGLEEVSSEENFQDGFHRHEPVNDSLDERRRKRKELHQSRKERKRERDRLVPGVVPIPRISPNVIINEIQQEETRDREGIKRKHKKASFTSVTFGDDVKPPKSKKMRHLNDVKSLIPEISISVPKPLPPLPELKPFFGTMSMAPGLIPANLGPPPPLRFGGSNLSPSVTITPAAPTQPVSSKESGRKAGSSIPLPSNVCSSVTITRIDMPSSSQEAQYDNSATPGIGIQLGSGKQSPLPVLQTDSSSGITITPILMTGDSVKSERFEKAGGSGGALAKLEEDLRSKEQRRKDKEKRKELKKEKKKEKRDKIREKERTRDKEEKVTMEKKERKEKVREFIEQTVPKLTLKISSNASTPVDSPSRVSERTDTPPPPPRKITIKPIEDIIRRRTPSPEMARFSPLVTRPPKEKIHKVSSPKPSPPVVVSAPPEKVSSLEKKGSSGKSSKSRSKASSSQSGLVTETVGFYIDEHGNKVWICPAVGCGREDDGSPMIGCDSCDDWYHFACVGIEETPGDDEHWYCPRCVKKGPRKGR